MDEAQNATPEQMKMILTRQGFNSKMVVTGDPTQVDLPQGQRSGLIEVIDVLRGVEGIQFVQFDDRDVVRHSLVQRIVKAYERYNEAIGANRQLTLRLADPAAVDGAQAAPVSNGGAAPHGAPAANGTPAANGAPAPAANEPSTPLA
jgi:phosphate starvation-inducible PhoH-like protein